MVVVELRAEEVSVKELSSLPSGFGQIHPPLGVEEDLAKFSESGEQFCEIVSFVECSDPVGESKEELGEGEIKELRARVVSYKSRFGQGIFLALLQARRPTLKLWQFNRS